MKMRDVCTRYTTSRVIAKSTAVCLWCSVRLLERFAGRRLCASELTDDLLNSWIASLKTKPATICTHRGNILTLLRFAADLGLCAEPVARRIRKPPKPKPKPQAWSIDELRRVLRVVDNLAGNTRRYGRPFPACVYFGCLTRVAYQTGLRRGNLFSLRQSDVTDGGLVYVKHEKTGQPHLCTIEVDALTLLRSLPGDEPLRWRDNRSFYKRWKRICLAAKVPHGGPQRIRKTAATQVWLVDQTNPSRVQQFLGHLTGDMWRHYVDLSQGTQRPPKPPAL